MKFILTFIIAFCLCVFVFAVFVMIREEISFKNHRKVIKAIRGYHAVCRSTGQKPMVDYDDMEEFDKTEKRVFDWGCKNILPKEKFELIKPFLED